jgi:transcriptional regulator with XRE-family HTH domain
MDLCSVIGSNIRKLRKAQGFSQEELAFRAEIDRSYLSEIENGQKNLSVLMLDQIAAALGVEMKELLEGYRRAPRRPIGDNHEKQ